MRFCVPSFSSCVSSLRRRSTLAADSAMNAPAFVLAAACPARAVLTARPWLCGTRVASAARLPRSSRSALRVFACAPPPVEGIAETPAEQPPAEDPVAQAPVDEPVVEVVPGEPIPEEPVAEAAADEPVAEAAAEEPADDPVEEAAADEPVADAAVDEPADEPVAEAADEPVVEAADEPVTEGVTAENAVDEGAEVVAEELKRKRRRGRKREVTLPLEEIKVGQELEGVVRSVTDYGAFVSDMGTPTDGLLHVSQLTAGFVEKVTDVVNVGDKVKVRVLGIDIAKGNFSLTMKTPEEVDAKRSGSGDGSRKSRRDDQSKKWADFSFDPQVFVDAKVTSVTDFGAFCKLIDENGELLESAPTEGLIHISELSDRRVENVSDVVSVGDVVKVRVMATDRKRNRISMSLKEYSESSGDGGKRDLSADIANAQTNQPKFKTTFELAFERAKAPAEQ